MSLILLYLDSIYNGKKRYKCTFERFKGHLKGFLNTVYSINVENAGPSYTADGSVNGEATVEDSLAVPQALNTELLCDPAIPLLGIHTHRHTHVRACMYTHAICANSKQMLIAALFIIAYQLMNG